MNTVSSSYASGGALGLTDMSLLEHLPGDLSVLPPFPSVGGFSAAESSHVASQGTSRRSELRSLRQVCRENLPAFFCHK